MTDDTFLAELRAAWTQQPPGAEQTPRRLAHRRARERLKLLGAAFAVLAYAGLALLFAARAADGGPTVYWLAAIAFALSVPVMLVELVQALRDTRIEYEETPLGLLHEARHRIAAARRALWGCRLAALVLCGSVLGLAAMWAAGEVAGRRALLIGLVWGGVAAATWGWQVRRGRQLAAEAARCERLLAEYRGADA